MGQSNGRQYDTSTISIELLPYCLLLSPTSRAMYYYSGRPTSKMIQVITSLRTVFTMKPHKKFFVDKCSIKRTIGNVCVEEPYEIKWRFSGLNLSSKAHQVLKSLNTAIEKNIYL